MSRPYSWYPLAGSDPIPGDPAAVRYAGNRYTEVASDIQTAARRLREIADLDANDADSVRAVSEKASEVAGKIDDAHGRYSATGSALTTYANALEAAQSRSAQALTEAQNADQALTAAQGRVRVAGRNLDDADDDTDDTEMASLRRSLATARGDREDAEAALARARAELDAAIVDRDTAASRAEEAIRTGMSGDDLGDSWWDNWGSAIVNAISSVAGIIAGVAGILALVLCWVPVLGQALAVVAAVATAVKLVADIALLAAGEGSWSDVIWGVVGLATFGVGRVISVAARGASTGAQGVARLNAGRIAATSAASRASQGVSTGSARTVINSLVGSRLGDLSRFQARPMAQQAITTVRGLFTDSAGLASLKPGALWSDVRALGGFNWSGAMTTVQSNFAAAGSNPLAVLAASQADGDMVRAITGLDDISSALQSLSPGVQSAVTTANVANGISGGTVAAGTFDQVIGFSTVQDWVSGESSPISLVTPVTEVVGWFNPSPADRLNLP